MKAHSSLVLIILVLALSGFATQSKRQLVQPTVQEIQVVKDNFSGPDGTALTAHPSDLGSQWYQESWSQNGVMSLSSNSAVHNSAPYRTVYYQNALLNANQYVQVKVTRVGAAGVPYIYFRLDASGIENGYSLKYDSDRHLWLLISVFTYEGAGCGVAGCNEYEEGSYSDSFNVGESRIIKITAEGSALKVYFNSIKGIDIVDVDHHAAGFIGLGLSNTGFSFDDLDAGNITGSGPAPSPTASPSPYSSPSPGPSASPSPSPDCHWVYVVEQPRYIVQRCQ